MVVWMVIHGENCGIVNIHNDLKVYAYGGGGSNTVPSLNSGTNSGGSGYPAAGIGGRTEHGRSRAEIGLMELGGYVGTWGDEGDCYRTNGNNGLSLLRSAFDNDKITGIRDESYRGHGDDAASYFSYGVQNYNESILGTNKNIKVPQIGGQGGVAYRASYIGAYPSGSGGIAGSGGMVSVSPNSSVNAFNGDRITNDDYISRIPDFDKDGNDIGTNSYVLTKYGTSDKTSPLKIFAQSGILRDVYYTNLCWGVKPRTGYDYFSGMLGDQLEESTKDVKAATTYDEIECHLIRKEKTIGETGYENPETRDCYGIGSGAGYIEVSNGTYKIDPSLN